MNAHIAISAKRKHLGIPYKVPRTFELGIVVERLLIPDRILREKRVNTKGRTTIRGQSRLVTGHLASSPACKALKRRCRHCKKIGHLDFTCRPSGYSAKVGQVDDTSSHSSERTVCVVERHKRGIYASIAVEGRTISFLLDIRSSVTILAEELYHHLFCKHLPFEAYLSATFGLLQVKHKSWRMFCRFSCVPRQNCLHSFVCCI